MSRSHICYALSNNPELDAVRSFFDWQCVVIEFFHDDSIFKITRGNRLPVLFEFNKPVAQGYFEIIDFWRNNGYCLA